MSDLQDRYEFSELKRRTENFVIFGNVSEVSEDGTEASVELDGITTAMLPILQRRAGDDAEKWTLSVGEQVCVLCPSGVIDNGVIIGSLIQDSTRIDGKGRVKRTSDGVVVREESGKSHRWSVEAKDVPLSVDVKAKNFDLSIEGTKIQLTAKGALTFGLKGTQVEFSIDESGNVALKGTKISFGGTFDPTDGVLTAKVICPLTGVPHSPASTLVFASLTGGTP